MFSPYHFPWKLTTIQPHLDQTLLVPTNKALHSQLGLSSEAWPIHCMMTMQFRKLQASWNPVLRKPRTLPELLINYWRRTDKCTRLTIPMTFLSPDLNPFCRSACLHKVYMYTTESYRQASSEVLIQIIEDLYFQQCISLQILTVLLSPLPKNWNKHSSMPGNYSFTLSDSRHSSPILLASHQSLLMGTHRGNQHANLMEICKHLQRISDINVITSMPLGVNIKSIKH